MDFSVVKKNAKVLGLSGLIIIIDQITKILIKYFLDINQAIPLVGKYIGLRFIENPGMAFGIQVGNKFYFIILQSIASFLILIFLFRMQNDHKWTRIALASILGGAIGNLIDRVAFGKVVDFIEMGPWPIFNFADIAVTFGMIILIFVVFFEKKEKGEFQEEKFGIN